MHLVHGPRIGSSVARQKDFSSAIRDHLKTKQQAFSSIGGWSSERFDLGHGGEAHYADGMWVSGSFFDALEVQPVLGRLIAPSDDRAGCGIQGAVISFGFWQREFTGRANAIGSTVSLDRISFPIIGITPASFSAMQTLRDE